MTPLAFLDIEASGLGRDSYPIEIGWVLEDGTGEAHLIRPESGWRQWSDAAQSLHGITREELAAAGRPAAEVAVICMEALRSRRVFSDAPTADQFWLNRLTRAGGARSEVGLFPFEEALRLAREPLWHRLLGTGLGRASAEAAYRDLAPRLTAKARVEEAGRQRVHPRALEDARSMWRVWSSLHRSASARANLRGSPD